MAIFDDIFSIELNHPLDKEAWKVLEDAELDNTEHIYFTTPSGKRVDFIKTDVLDKIRAEIKEEAEYAYADFDEYKKDVLLAEPDELPDDDFRYGLERAIEIINKYKVESNWESE